MISMNDDDESEGTGAAAWCILGALLTISLLLTALL